MSPDSLPYSIWHLRPNGSSSWVVSGVIADSAEEALNKHGARPRATGMHEGEKYFVAPEGRNSDRDTCSIFIWGYPPPSSPRAIPAGPGRD